MTGDFDRSARGDMEARKRPASVPLLAEEEQGADGRLLEDGHHRHKHEGDTAEANIPGGVREEWRSILLLLFLYILQGIPLGLCSAVPLMLQNRHVSYKEQALFSFVTWPFSVKLLWAPIVDSVYSSSFGRRKSWLVPTQYAIGLFLFWLSRHARALLGDDSEGASAPDILLLTVVFVALNFLAATQDIAVDGWALTMLSRRHVGYASTCNSVGQTTGYFLGNVVFLALESVDFCNRYLRVIPQKEGIVTLEGRTRFAGNRLRVLVPMSQALEILQSDFMSSIHFRSKINSALLTYSHCLYTYLCSFAICFALFFASQLFAMYNNSATKLKAQALEILAFKKNIAIKRQVFVRLLQEKSPGKQKLPSFFFFFSSHRLLFGVLFMFLLSWTYRVKNVDGTFPIYYYVVIICVYAVHQVTVFSIYVSLMAFHARVSDPAIGGTYMTLLNTVTNLGGNWPATVSLWFVDNLTFQHCQGAGDGWTQCSSKEDQQACAGQGGTCETTLDGYYIEMVLCILLGFVWLLYARRRARWLQSLPPAAWKCS
ncbi:unnamed protein product [Ixodes pacificus]